MEQEGDVATDIASLVDADRGLIGRRIFIEPEIYVQELERVFAAVGSSRAMSQIPQPGDFFTTYGRRSGSGGARYSGASSAFECAVIAATGRATRCGNAATFTCAYHG
jgi:hypothetical protein